MKTKHTPGPWHIIETASTRAKGQSDYLLANRSPHIHGVLTGPMSDADLNLISTAPEMLEALIELTEVLRRYGGIPSKDPFKYDKLIAKARGES